MCLRSVSCALIVSLLGWTAASAQSGADVQTPSEVFSEAEVAKAINTLRSDPNLEGERTTRILRWQTEQKEEEKEANTSMPRWLRWIGELFKWLGESARLLMWVIVALLIAILAVSLIRILRGVSLGKGFSVAANAPTHVRDLDIRPESLPSDIGKTALDLWARGDRRASLSLLYRGLLSRLVHNHGTPIKHSSTEGECRTLALQHLPAGSHEYVGLLIRVWQGAVYGATEPDDATVRRLCEDFAPALEASSRPQQAATSPARAVA